MSIDRRFRELVSGRWPGPVAATLRCGLGVLEWPYRWIIERRSARFDRQLIRPHKVAAPVISVGNLTVGGTGKSPLVAWLAGWYQNRGIDVTIISRGYGSRGGRPNDEALELAARLPGVPHLQNRDRVAAAKKALGDNPRQVLILDDAFQHRRLARDLDIVLLDALEPFGYGRLLPRGLLREPVEALARAQVVALSRSDAVDEPFRRKIERRARELAPGATWLELAHRPRRLFAADGSELTLAEISDTRIAAFCGIGNPVGFRHTLATSGLNVAAWLELPDHCPYGERVTRAIEAWLAALSVEHVVCTAKDLVKIPRTHLGGKRLWALEIELEILRGKAELEALLRRVAPHD